MRGMRFYTVILFFCIILSNILRKVFKCMKIYSCWIVLILETRNLHTAVLHPRCPTTHPFNTSDVIEDVLKRDTSKKLVIECQFAIHTRATWMRCAS